MAVGLVCTSCQGSYFNWNGKKYFYIEVTQGNWEIGQIPPEFVNANANIYDIKQTAFADKAKFQKQEEEWAYDDDKEYYEQPWQQLPNFPSWEEQQKQFKDALDRTQKEWKESFEAYQQQFQWYSDGVEQPNVEVFSYGQSQIINVQIESGNVRIQIEGYGKVNISVNTTNNK